MLCKELAEQRIAVSILLPDQVMARKGEAHYKPFLLYTWCRVNEKFKIKNGKSKMSWVLLPS